MRFRIRPLALILSVSLVALLVWGCGDDDPTAPPLGNPMVELLAPTGDLRIEPGSTVDLTWETEDGETILDVTLSYTDESMGDEYEEIASELPASGTHTWTAPMENRYGVRFKVTATNSEQKTASDMTEMISAVVHASPRGYVTSLVCKDCHSMKYEEVFKSGHPYKISKVEGGPPTFPFTSVPNPPTGFTWDDITYVIGGYNWKARFMDKDGYILVTGLTGVEVQYNHANPEIGVDSPGWGNYHANDTAPKPYTCGTCHTTGWQTFAENGGVHQDGLEGIMGTWEEPGIGCEACHTPGARHVVAQDAAFININRNSELCGSCHFRDTNHGILASGGFIRHHEQYDEMISAGHSFQRCTTCHDPHIGVQHGRKDEGGLVASCTDCHSDYASPDHNVAATCEDCHMPRLTKSAIANGPYTGDVRTHIFKIDADKANKDDMFYTNEDGTLFAHGFMTLDAVCYQCHADTDGNGQAVMNARELDRATLLEEAKKIHR